MIDVLRQTAVIKKLSVPENCVHTFSGIAHVDSNNAFFTNKRVFVKDDPKRIELNYNLVKDQIIDCKILLHHDTICVGRVISFEIIDDKILYIRGVINDEGMREYLESNHQFLSVCFTTFSSKKTNLLYSQKLLEISLTANPANYNCKITFDK
jgi:hypothetical protein